MQVKTLMRKQYPCLFRSGGSVVLQHTVLERLEYASGQVRQLLKDSFGHVHVMLG